MIRRHFTNVLADDLDRTARFYQDLLGLTRHYDSDWFVILTAAALPGMEFGILDRGHPVVPHEAAGPAGGALLTFVVDDVDAVFDTARRLGARIIAPPTDMDYGQRRLVLCDPDGTVLDISAPVARR
jgi:catechol 2,3-dioxygenase-like lactoylglutathione lyase family enzyme